MWARRLLGFLGVMLLASPAAARKAEAGSGAQGARWQAPEVSMILDPTTADLGFDILDTLIMAVSAWQVVADTVPTITVERGPEYSLGYKPGEQNANTVSFAKDGTARAKGALAITVITFDLDRNLILDADIVLNGEHRFSAMSEEDAQQETAKIYDVQNVLAHELGHFLGLGEDYENETATMYAYSLPGETAKRDLSQNDARAISELYNEPLPEPEHPQGAASCGAAHVATGGRLPIEWLSISFLSLATMFWMRRREHRRSTAAATLLTLTLCAGLVDAPQMPYAGDAVTVTEVDSHWEDGLIVTEAALIPFDCNSCQAERVTLLGGRVGAISQVVNGLQPLEPGQKLSRRALSRHPY